jgi:hypothetical protein
MRSVNPRVALADKTQRMALQPAHAIDTKALKLTELKIYWLGKRELHPWHIGLRKTYVAFDLHSCIYNSGFSGGR